MAATEIKVQMQQRRDTAAGWTAANPTLLAGELGFETDTNKIKIGDGSTAWSSLSYIPAFAITSYPLATADIANDAITGDKLANDITIAGDLTVNGTTTTINSTTLQVDDKNIELGTVATPSDTTADGGGITLKGATDKTLTWVNSTDCWTFDQALDLTAGTESAPALVFDADVNTGIYHPAADELAISTAGNERLRIDSSGNVGIGTDSPTTNLEVASSSNTGIRLRDTTGSFSEIVYNDNGSTTSVLNISCDAGNDSVGASNIRVFVDGSEAMRIKSDGNVGIGTDSPSSLLHVSSATGSASPTPTEIRIATTSNASDWSVTEPWSKLSFYSGDSSGSGPKEHASINAVCDIANGGQSSLTFDTDSTERMRIDNAGNVGIGTSSPDTLLHIKDEDVTQSWSDNAADTVKIEGLVEGINFVTSSTGFLAFSDAADRAQGVIEYLHSSDSMQFDTAGSEKMRIASNGNVGIGTTNPAVALDVNGEIRASTGVLFGTDTAAANTLDDYEEGTWTPQYGGSTSDPTVTYDQQNATYTKIGNVVTCSFRLRTDSVSGGSGDLRIKGLPFNVGNNEGKRGSLNVGLAIDFAGETPITGLPRRDDSFVALYASGATNTDDMLIMNITDLHTGTNKNVMYCSITYLAPS